MEKLIAELLRLFVPAGALPAELLTRQVLGQDTQAAELLTASGLTRAVAIPFEKSASGPEAAHWTALCETANALQARHGFPAPAVSVTGLGYCLWLSLATPVPVPQARQFAARVRQAYAPDSAPRDGKLPLLPPCLDARNGKWAAFIHPGMGASFADEPWLDMAPPSLAQAAFLEELASVGPAQFAEAFAALGQPEPGAPAQAAPVPVASAPAPGAGLLLRDASLEDIVRHLHALNIEPSFRHLIGRSGED
jgi:hypothetical protein